jgi:hypothetical protein
MRVAALIVRAPSATARRDENEGTQQRKDERCVAARETVVRCLEDQGLNRRVRRVRTQLTRGSNPYWIPRAIASSTGARTELSVTRELSSRPDCPNDFAMNPPPTARINRAIPRRRTGQVRKGEPERGEC